MGTFKWPMRIASMDGQQARDIEATVDTGASFTTLPSRLLRELGIEPMGKRGFLLADSQRIEMDNGEVRATIDGDTVTTIVVFGEDDAPPLLGALLTCQYLEYILQVVYGWSCNPWSPPQSHSREPSRSQLIAAGAGMSGSPRTLIRPNDLASAPGVRALTGTGPTSSGGKPNGDKRQWRIEHVHP